MFKKVISAILVVSMAVAMSATAFAVAPTRAANADEEEVHIMQPIVEPIQILAGNLDSAAYGGIYFNKDRKICVNVIDEASVLRAMKKSNISKKDVTFVKAKYTMKEMMAARDRLAEQREELGLISLGINERNNCLSVAITGTTKEAADKVFKVAAFEGTELEMGAKPNTPTGGNTSAVEPEDNISIPFKKGMITEAYSFDYANRSYHRITDLALLTDMSLRLEDYTPAVSKDKNQVGFLVFTGKGEKYEYYLDSDEKKASIADKPLIELSKTCNKKFPASVQWLAFMSSSNIERVSFAGATGKDMSLKKPAPTLSYDLSINTTEKRYFEPIAAFLKTIEVSNPKIEKYVATNYPSNDSRMYQMSIDFTSGANYSIVGSSDGLKISSSYMDEMIYYQCAENEIKALRDFMSDLGIGERRLWQ